jgi:hypothetical protein
MLSCSELQVGFFIKHLLIGRFELTRAACSSSSQCVCIAWIASPACLNIHQLHTGTYTATATASSCVAAVVSSCVFVSIVLRRCVSRVSVQLLACLFVENPGTASGVRAHASALVRYCVRHAAQLCCCAMLLLHACRRCSARVQWYYNKMVLLSYMGAFLSVANRPSHLV